MDEYLQSAWDARQEYTKQLHEIDRNANLEKMSIELKNDKIMEHISKYFSLVRFLYRQLRPFFNENEKNEYDEKFQKFETKLDAYLRKSKSNQKVAIPKKLINDIEKIHNYLNEIRFKHNLIIPKKIMPESDPEKAVYEGLAI